jgi:hypothetical protein
VEARSLSGQFCLVAVTRFSSCFVPTCKQVLISIYDSAVCLHKQLCSGLDLEPPDQRLEFFCVLDVLM